MDIFEAYTNTVYLPTEIFLTTLLVQYYPGPSGFFEIFLPVRMNEPHEATAPKSSRGRGGREKPRFSLPGLVATGFRRFVRLVLFDAEKIF